MEFWEDFCLFGSRMGDIYNKITFLVEFGHFQLILTFIIDYYFYVKDFFRYREGAKPEIKNSDCDNCPLCRSRSSQLSDTCERIDAFERIFYAMVVAHKTYNDCVIIFKGMNLMNVTNIPL